jgi:hypothetical protein
MATHIPIQPALLTLARKRAGLEIDALTKRFPKLAAWESGERLPTLRQLEDFARAARAGGVSLSACPAG